MTNFYNLEDFKEYALDEFGVEDLNCGDVEVLSALKQSQERVLDLVGYGCDFCFNCCCTEETFKEAVYIMTYEKVYILSQDEDANYKELEKTAYFFLKRNDCINF